MVSLEVKLHKFPCKNSFEVLKLKHYLVSRHFCGVFQDVLNSIKIGGYTKK